MGGEDSGSGIEVADAPERGQYEARIDGRLVGLAQYHRLGDPSAAGGVVVLTHTEVDDDYEGRGVGGALVRGALDDLRGRGALVRPHCPYVKAWIERHPEYADVLAR